MKNESESTQPHVDQAEARRAGAFFQSLFALTRATSSALVRASRWMGKGLARQARRVASSERIRRARGPAKAAVRVIGLAGLLSLLCVGFGAGCFVRVRPGTIGVKQVDLGRAKGIVERDYAPGIYFSPRFLYSTWHHLDARTNAVSFAPQAEGGLAAPLELRTREGNTATVSAFVPFSIVRGEAFEIVREGKKGVYRHRVKSTVEKVLIQELAQLTSEDLATSDVRLTRSDATLELLNRELADHHVRAEGIYISGVSFPVEYEKKNQEKQLESQVLVTNQVLARREAAHLEKQHTLERLLAEEADLVANLERLHEAQRVEQEEGFLAEAERANERLAIEIKSAEAELTRELEREFEAARIELQQRALAEQRLANDLLLAEIEAEEKAEIKRLEAEMDAERREEAERKPDEVRHAIALLEGEIVLEEKRLEAELDRSFAGERIAAEVEMLAVKRDALTYERARETDADGAYQKLAADGRLALARAEALHDRLQGEALASPGGRVYLAREAATNLQLETVTLNSSDPRVPSVLDLDRMIALIMGGGEAVQDD